jgi:hypothetical protein
MPTECRTKPGHKDISETILKCGIVQIFGNSSNTSKFYSEGN